MKPTAFKVFALYAAIICLALIAVSEATRCTNIAPCSGDPTILCYNPEPCPEYFSKENLVRRSAVVRGPFNLRSIVNKKEQTPTVQNLTPLSKFLARLHRQRRSDDNELEVRLNKQIDSHYGSNLKTHKKGVMKPKHVHDPYQSIKRNRFQLVQDSDYDSEDDSVSDSTVSKSTESKSTESKSKKSDSKGSVSKITPPNYTTQRFTTAEIPFPLPHQSSESSETEIPVDDDRPDEPKEFRVTPPDSQTPVDDPDDFDVTEPPNPTFYGPLPTFEPEVSADRFDGM